MPRVIEWFLRIRPEKISWLKFILEGYDGLAVLSTLARETGLVRIQTLDCHFSATMRLIASMTDELTPFRTSLPAPSYGVIAHSHP